MKIERELTKEEEGRYIQAVTRVYQMSNGSKQLILPGLEAYMFPQNYLATLAAGATWHVAKDTVSVSFYNERFALSEST